MFKHDFFAMASRCEVCLEGIDAEEAQSVCTLAEDEVVRLERKFSRYRPDSELSRINRAAHAGEAIEVDAEVASLLGYADIAYRESDGLFDITSGLLREVWDFKVARLPKLEAIAALLPRIGFEKLRLTAGRLNFAVGRMELDFGGLGKDYAADRAAEICLEAGARSGFVNLGGDIRVIGSLPGGAPWVFGVSHPRDPDRPLVTIDLTEGALATSGDYERFIEVDGKRYCHILNPRTCWPADGVMSASVVADRALVGGTLSTIAMLKGHEARRWLDARPVSYALVDAEGRLFSRDLDRLV